MEKNSELKRKKFKANLSEKFRYLFISEVKNYELFNLAVTDVDWNDDNTIREMSVDLELDYQGACDGEHHQLCRMLEKISNDVHTFFFQHQIDPKTLKFSSEVNNLTINDPYFLSLDFKLDELHKCLIYVRIDYYD